MQFCPKHWKYLFSLSLQAEVTVNVWIGILIRRVKGSYIVRHVC